MCRSLMLAPSWLGVNGRCRQAEYEAPSSPLVAVGLHSRQHRFGAGEFFLSVLGRRPKRSALKQEVRCVLDLSIELAVPCSFVDRRPDHFVNA